MIDLDAIEARLKAATPGPWESYRNETGTPKHCFKIEITGNVKKIAERRVASTPVCALHSGFVWFEGDGELIANAPTDLAALIAEVKRLRADLAACATIAREFIDPDDDPSSESVDVANGIADLIESRSKTDGM